MTKTEYNSYVAQFIRQSIEVYSKDGKLLEDFICIADIINAMRDITDYDDIVKDISSKYFDVYDSDGNILPDYISIDYVIEVLKRNVVLEPHKSIYKSKTDYSYSYAYSNTEAPTINKPCYKNNKLDIPTDIRRVNYQYSRRVIATIPTRGCKHCNNHKYWVYYKGKKLYLVCAKCDKFYKYLTDYEKPLYMC